MRTKRRLIRQEEIDKMKISLEYLRERALHFREKKMYSAMLAYSLKADEMEDRVKRYERAFGGKKRINVTD